MIEIEFRGKTFSDEWVYGYLSVLPEKFPKTVEPGVYITSEFDSPFASRVRPETVGQYIGVKDENGVKIYHGDRLQMFRHSDDVGKHIPNKVWEDGKYHPDIRTVQFKLGTFYTSGLCGIEISFMHLARPGESYEIVGNIHDEE
ncbi:MAG: hypothetical protein KAS66_00015 [Candidatus Omnitrophica bacterium]|nr:hypothetical protein [Candidatus Omnitrophota bacterium]